MSAASTSADSTDKTKVFVGNLSFKITQDDLKTHFSEVSDGVLTANIITRGPRSLGYGFVEFATLASAEKAVAAMNKKEIDGRAINVEVAKPRVPRAEGDAPAPREGGPARRRRRGTGNGNTATANKEGGAVSSPASSSATSAGPAKNTGRGRRNNNSNNNNNNNNNNKEKVETKDEDKVPSKSTLFIANLPFSINDEKLKAIFTEAGQNPTAVRVVMRRNRSKGFGFAEFATEGEQSAALSFIDNKEIDGRTLIAKIAFDVSNDTPAVAASS